MDKDRGSRWGRRWGSVALERRKRAMVEHRDLRRFAEEVDDDAYYCRECRDLYPDQDDGLFDSYWERIKGRCPHKEGESRFPLLFCNRKNSGCGGYWFRDELCARCLRNVRYAYVNDHACICYGACSRVCDCPDGGYPRNAALLAALDMGPKRNNSVEGE
jgi:hypothetical protein